MSYANSKPYGEWLDRNLIRLQDLKIPNQKIESYTPEQLDSLRKAFGYDSTDVSAGILAMARTGVEPTVAMGDDTPLACLSMHHPPLFNYFKQMFAQVTNPPAGCFAGKSGHQHHRVCGQPRQSAGGKSR